jgi:hypothetical protein
MASTDSRATAVFREALPANIVKGRVEIKGTRAGVSGLIVRVYDVGGPGGPTGGQRRPLGSTLTDGGFFLVRFEDELLLQGRPDASRPDLLVSVIAPETPNNGTPDQPLFESEVRRRAAREESFLIHVNLGELKKRSVLLPQVLGALAGDPRAAGAAAELERERQTKVREQITAVRRKAVLEARRFEEEADNALRDRILQHLTGLTPDVPEWRRFVPPGEDAQKAARANQKEAIGTVVNRQGQEGVTTYLVLSDAERAALGNPPDAEKVERLLRRGTTTASLLRDDPAAVACLRRRDENPFDPPAPPEPPPEPEPEPGTTASVDAKVKELVQGISLPETPLTDGGRPDQEAVDVNVRRLQLTKGPADVAAFYDFHNLQIAFDHVWEDARAEGVLDSAKQMYRAISLAGGEPRLALASARDPLKALAREAQLVRQAEARFSAPATTARMNSGPMTALGNEMGANAGWSPVGSEGIPDPPVPPRPGPPDLPDLPDLQISVGDKGYPFTLFAAGSTNFGLLVVYRLRMEPTVYQVGRLVSTQTLAPKESVSVTMRRVVKTSFNRKQVRASQQMRKEEADETQRDEAEIVNRAQAKTNYALTSEGGYDLGPFGSGSFTTSLTKDKEGSSQETKKAFREAVRKAAQEIRDEVKWEQESGETTETENIEKREISNPNDELALTYIFYELHRRYIASERLHALRPVVLVAQRVPPPHEINDQWVRRYDWIIRRFLPDDSFRPALEYLVTRERGDQIVLAELQRHMESLRTTVEALRLDVLGARKESLEGYAAIQNIARDRANLENREDLFWMLHTQYRERLATSPESKDALKILDEAAREAYERAVREERDLRARLEREVTALQVATETFTKAQADYTNHRAQIDRLIEHLQSDVLRYMHGIWSYEHPDQQYLRHHTIQVPVLEAVQRRYTLRELSEWPLGVVPRPGKKCYRVTFTVRIDDDLESDGKIATLAELADLDHPLGFRANYIIYPLKRSNALTDFMATPYLDAELGLRDPDGPGNWTLQEFSNYVQCLRESLGDRFVEVEDELRRQYLALLADPLRDGEEIVVPTKSLYMQMLVDPGKALEEFKEQHRLWDVEKVKAEVLAAQLDNLRRAKLVLDDRLEDPSVESVKNVYYRSETPPHDGDE